MRIRQEHTFLTRLLSDLQSGQMLPAAFQRPYVWTTDDCMALFESILRGYPVGSFLAWLPVRGTALSTVARMRLGPVLAAQASTDPLLLLDGQNRLATLAWMAHDWAQPAPVGLTKHEASVWNSGQRLVVDLKDQCLRFVPEAEANAGFTLPSAALLNNSLGNQLMRERWEGSWAPFGQEAIVAGLKWFDVAQNAFRDARIIFTAMEYATPAEARDAFLHICRTGVPMSQQDFDQAIQWAVTPGP